MPLSLHPRTAAAVAGAVVLLIGIVWGVVLERIAYERREAVQDTVRTNTTLALAYEQQTARMLETLDQAVRLLRREYRRAGARADVRALFKDGVLDARLYVSAAIVDAAGRVVASKEGPSSLDVSDRAYFIYHRDRPADEPRLGEPTFSRVTGQPSIQLTRRIDRPDGSFGGVAMVGVAPELLADFFNRIEIGERAILQLVGRDGIARARRIGNRVTFGQDVAGILLLDQASKRPHGNFVGDGRLDGVARFVSYRSLHDYPLVVSAGIAVDDALAQFVKRQREYHALATLTTLLILALGVGFLFVGARQEAAAADLRRGETRYRAAFDEAPIGMTHTSLDGRFLRVNRKYCDMLGYTQEELLSRTFADITHPQDLAATAALRQRALQGGASLELEKRNLRKDGNVTWVVVTIALMRDANGEPDYLIAMVRDISARKEAQAKLEHHEQYDVLTGLPNRALFGDRVAQALVQAKRKGWTTGLLYINVDCFKDVNGAFGHAAGDEVLCQVARRLERNIRAGDSVARIGSDEFAVALAELARATDASLVAHKVLDALSAPYHVAGNEVALTASIGIAIESPDGDSGAALLTHAGVAMARAKELGRNSIHFYSAGMNERASQHLRLQVDLRHALERGEFLLHFQPKASLSSGRISGFEALLRWQPAGKPMVSPAEFIPLLEETGLIVPVGVWVVGAVCAQLDAWRQAGLQPVPVAVNVSARQFTEELCEVIEAALARHQVEPALLEMEITESDAMHDPARVIAVVKRLHELGVGVSIDDFGTGYSSLGYLKRFPVQALKLDRSFVMGLPEDADDVSIAKAVISMAHSLGLKVVAEGVETEAQRGFLAQNRCDQMQGYLLSRPLPSDRCIAYLAPAAEAAAPVADARARYPDGRAMPSDNAADPIWDDALPMRQFKT